MSTPAEDKMPAVIRMIRQSYLALSPEEERALAHEVAGLLTNVDILAALPVTGGLAPPTVTPEELREDVVTPSLPAAEALRNAPAAHDNFISVPKIIARPEENE